MTGIADRAGDFFQRRCSFLQRCGLLLGAFCQFLRRVADFTRCRGDAGSVLRDDLHRVTQLGGDRVEILAGRFHAGHEAGFDRLIELAVGQIAKTRAEHADRAHARGHVGGKFHHLADLAVQVGDRVVGRLNPDFLAALAVTDEFIGNEFSIGEARPEFRVVL
ncbi:hypothetical protein D3C71_607960 [compost metagenome]